MSLRALAAAATDLVLPSCCVVCRSAGPALCLGCAPFQPPVLVMVAGRPVHAAGWYEQALRRALLAYKERGRRDLEQPLGQRLARAVRWAARDGPPSGDAAVTCVIPIPSSAAAARVRGGDHIRRMIRHTDARVVPALRVARRVADSAGLRAAERSANLAGAFTAAPPPAGVRRALVVDDIVTSGATLTEAYRALEAAGWPMVGAAVVAATPRRSGRPESSPGHG